MSLWVAIGVIATICLLVHFSTAKRNLVDVDISDTEVTVTPRGLNKVWALRAKVSFPVSAIRNAHLVSGISNLTVGWRWPGTAIPGLILAGTYRKKGEKSSTRSGTRETS